MGTPGIGRSAKLMRPCAAGSGFGQSRISNGPAKGLDVRRPAPSLLRCWDDTTA